MRYITLLDHISEQNSFCGSSPRWEVLAGLSHFVIVDITNPRSAPLELQATVPEYMIPFVPIIEKGEEPFAMFPAVCSEASQGN
jgi:hypothetical protein